MSKFSNIGERINRYTNSLIIENETLTSDELDEIFKNEAVKKRVSTLSMINCNISTIPESIINLKSSLLNLYLSHNNISELPSNLGKMNLFELYLTGNPIIVNKHNVDILYEIYRNKIGVNSHPKIYFDNKDRRTPRPYKNIDVIGNLDLVTGRVNKSNKPFNKDRLMVTKEGSDFDKLYQQIESTPIVQPEPSPKSSASSSSRSSRKSTSSRRSSRKSRSSRRSSRKSSPK